MDNQEVKYTLILEGIDRLESGLKKSKHHADELEGSMGHLKESVMHLAEAYAVFEIAKESLHEFTEHRVAVAELTQMYNNNSKSVHENLDQLKELAEEQEKLTGIHSENVMAAEQSLLKYKDIKVSYEELIPLAGNLATAMKTDIADSANTLGRALENPLRAARLLMQTGASPEQILMFQNLEKQGHAAKAQAYLIDILKDKYKDLAKVAFDNDPEKQLEIGMKEAKETLGEFLEKGLLLIMPYIKQLLEYAKDIVHWFEEHSTITKILTGTLLTLVGVYAAWETGLKLMTLYTGIAKVAQMELNAALLANPIGLVIIAVTALTVAIKYLTADYQELVDSYKRVGPQFMAEQIDKQTKSVENLAHYYHSLGMSMEAANKKALDSENLIVNARIANLKVQYEQAKMTLNQIELTKAELGIFGIFKDDKTAFDNMLAAKGALETALGQKKALNNPIEKGASKKGGEIHPALNQSDKVTGTKQVTINVTINKLVELIKIQSENIKEGVNAAGEDTAKALLAAVDQFSASADL